METDKTTEQIITLSDADLEMSKGSYSSSSWSLLDELDEKEGTISSEEFSFEMLSVCSSKSLGDETGDEQSDTSEIPRVDVGKRYI